MKITYNHPDIGQITVVSEIDPELKEKVNTTVPHSLMKIEEYHGEMSAQEEGKEIIIKNLKVIKNKGLKLSDKWETDIVEELICKEVRIYPISGMVVEC